MFGGSFWRELALDIFCYIIIKIRRTWSEYHFQILKQSAFYSLWEASGGHIYSFSHSRLSIVVHFFLSFETVSPAAHAGLELTKCPGVTLKFWSFCLHLPSTTLTGMCRQGWFVQNLTQSWIHSRWALSPVGYICTQLVLSDLPLGKFWPNVFHDNGDEEADGKSDSLEPFLHLRGRVSVCSRGLGWVLFWG